jgi:glutathione S-transferase
MVELYQLPPLWGLPNISPATMKLETWLRMAEIPYEARPADLAEAPKGKVPYIRNGGALMGDSTLIIEHLKKAYGKDPDRGLSKVEQAVSLAFRRMVKENLYWVITYSRWGDPQNWAAYEALLVSILAPDPVAAKQIAAALRDRMLAQLRGHGLGRHSQDEIYAVGNADLTAIADFLGDKPFFMGEHPTTADAAIFAYVENLLAVPISYPTKEYGLGLRNLGAYSQRMRARFYREMSPS